MLREFLDRIVELADSRQGFVSLDLPGGKTRLVKQPNGEVLKVDIPPLHRNFEAGNLEAFVNMLVTYGTKPLVFVYSDGDGHLYAKGFFDAEDRRERVSMHVSPSSAFIALNHLIHELDQSTVVRILRDRLVDCYDHSLLPSFRSIDFKRRNDGTKTTEHGKESLGRSVEMTVKSKNGEIPEHMLFEIPLFANDPFDAIKSKVRMSVDLKAASERIQFNFVGDDMEKSQKYATWRVASMIQDELANERGKDSGLDTVVVGRPDADDIV